MKKFEEWWEANHPKEEHKSLCRQAYEAGQANAIPELTTQEWERLKDELEFHEHRSCVRKLINQSLAIRERQK